MVFGVKEGVVTTGPGVAGTTADVAGARGAATGGLVAFWARAERPNNGKDNVTRRIRRMMVSLVL